MLNLSIGIKSSINIIEGPKQEFDKSKISKQLKRDKDLDKR